MNDEFKELINLINQSVITWKPIPNVQFKNEKVEYIKMYLKIMINNWEYENLKRVLKAENMDQAINLIESYDYTPFNDWKKWNTEQSIN